MSRAGFAGHQNSIVPSPPSPRNKTKSNRSGASSRPMDDHGDDHQARYHNEHQEDKENGIGSGQLLVAESAKAMASHRLKNEYGVESSHRAKILVETARTTLRQIDAMKSLARYLDDHLNEIFNDGNKAPEAADIRYVMVKAWTEELLRFLAVKIVANDVESPCKLDAAPPIATALRGLQNMPRAYKRLCRKLGVKSGFIEQDFDNDDLDGDYMHDANNQRRRHAPRGSARNEDEERTRFYAMKKRRYIKMARAYQHCFDQVQPELYWPEPKMPKEESLMAMLAESLNLSSDLANPKMYVKEMFQNGCKAEIPVDENHAKKLFQNGCRIDDDNGYVYDEYNGASDKDESSSDDY
mmetsp:Transcript_11960/g.25890  ORF Transcript_11960/g.25890 Transcript_11960/m.25890 type:complete len:354 (-) Transcript_11960:235-1296(-)